MSFVRILLISFLCILSSVNARAIESVNLDSYALPPLIESSVMADRFLQLRIQSLTLGLKSQQQRPSSSSSSTVAPAASSIDSKAHLGAAASADEVEEEIKNLKLDRLVLKLQQSDNPRIRASVDKYKEIIQDINAFETEYFRLKTEDEYLEIIADHLAALGGSSSILPEIKREIQKGLRQLIQVLSNKDTQEAFYSMLYRTYDSSVKEKDLERLLKIENINEFARHYILNIIVLNKDILNLYIDRLMQSNNSLYAGQKASESLKPADYAFSFHSFQSPTKSGANSPWKLHVSGVNMNAWYMFKYTLPYLVANNRTFKVYQSIALLDNFYNSGFLPQTGKLLTIYPYSHEESTELSKDLNDLMRLLGVNESDVVPVPNDVKVGDSPGVYGRYEGHNLFDSSYDRLLPWGDDLNEDRDAKCPFVQPGVDIKWEKGGETLVSSWSDRPTSWAKVPKLRKDIFEKHEGFQMYLNEEGWNFLHPER